MWHRFVVVIVVVLVVVIVVVLAVGVDLVAVGASPPLLFGLVYLCGAAFLFVLSTRCCSF